MSSPSSSRKPAPGLVDYSDSDSENDGTTLTETTKSPGISPSRTRAPITRDPNLPPLPSKFFDLYTTAPRLSKQDDPSAHGGRHRAIPHVEGNWPTHLYFEWNLSSAEIETIGRFIQVARDAIDTYQKFHQNETHTKLESFLYSELGTELPLHISMSRPIVLKTEQRDEFVQLLQNRLKKSAVEGFDVRFLNLEWVPNQDRTRWFWVLRATSSMLASTGQNPLAELLSMCNRVVRVHQQPGLYLTDGFGNTRDGFHVSIGWSLTEPPEQLRRDIATAQAALVSDISGLRMSCGALKLKIGNVVHALELGAATD